MNDRILFSPTTHSPPQNSNSYDNSIIQRNGRVDTNIPTSLGARIQESPINPYRQLMTESADVSKTNGLALQIFEKLFGSATFSSVEEVDESAFLMSSQRNPKQESHGNISLSEDEDKDTDDSNIEDFDLVSSDRLSLKMMKNTKKVPNN